MSKEAPGTVVPQPRPRRLTHVPVERSSRGHRKGTAGGRSADMTWIYFFGERNGEDIKVGKTGSQHWRDRLRSVQAEQTTGAEYVPLAAVRGVPNDEATVLRHFAPMIRRDKGSKREYLHPVPEVYEYVAWVRSQWFAAVDGDEIHDDAEHVDPVLWLPNVENGHRRIARPVFKPDQMVQDWETIPGPLQGTAWAWMPNPKASFQDYFTPPELIEAVRHGMGGIDLDAASHWAANKLFRIADYFTAQRSAFENDWHGRVWLNPPYGDNAPWWDRIIQQMDAGNVDQLAILSPVWSFSTAIARDLMARATLMILLSPTPKFWGNADGKTGTNKPHAIVYFGDRATEMRDALTPFGIPMRLDLDQIGSDR